MNARSSKANLILNFVLAVAALVLLPVAWSPRDSLYDRLVRGIPGEFIWSLLLLVVIGVGIVASYRFFAWRVFWFSVLVATGSGTFHNVRMERVLLWALVMGFALTYRRFLGKLSIYMIGHPSQSLILALFFCLLYGLIGTSYGVPSLFWAETFRGRFFSAFGSTLLLAVLGVNAFFLDDKYHANWKVVERFMKDWQIKFHLRRRELEARLPLRGSGARAGPEEGHRGTAIWRNDLTGSPHRPAAVFDADVAACDLSLDVPGRSPIRAAERSLHLGIPRCRVIGIRARRRPRFPRLASRDFLLGIRNPRWRVPREGPHPGRNAVGDRLRTAP